MMSAKPQQYVSGLGGGGGEHHGATGGPSSERKHSDAHDDLDFDFSMIVDADNEGLDFTLTNDAGGVGHVMQEHTAGNLPSHTSSNTTSRSIPIPSNQAVPSVTATASNPLYPSKQASHQVRSAASSRPGSHESSGSGFLSGILNPAATTFNNTQLSHTPPAAFGTSYEDNHFGKRQRSGSISGRLRSASDLEDRGLIDKNQKGILKDLIICGDEELQRALDQYEEGNPAILQEMIQSGALQNKAVPDLDLLGDLDLDFLTVHDIGDVPETGGNPGMYTLHNQQHPPAVRTGKLKPPPSFAAKQQANDGHGPAPTAPASMVSPVYDDGIGELEFTGDFTGDHHEGVYYGDGQGLNQPTSNSQRHGSETPPSFEEQRMRSNSLFSALINDPREAGKQDLQYGRWMDHVPRGNQLHMQAFNEAPPQQVHATASTSQSIPIPNASNAAEDDEDSRDGRRGPVTRRTPSRRKSDSALTMDRQLKAKIKQEQAEQKRREKQEKKEQKEREKQEKKEARLAAKADKKKKKDKDKKEQAMQVEEDEKPEHVPGSGRPRSMSDPNLSLTRDVFGLREVERPDGWVGAYSPESRKVRIEKFLAKRHKRVWTKTVKYDVRKNFADSRLRVKGRFVKKEDETLMRDLMSLA